MSHVVPDIIQKIVRGQNPVHILGDGSQVRHYTYGADLARGIVMAMDSDDALNQDFNLSTSESTTVKELVEVIWKKINPNEDLKIVNDPGFEYDVNKRVPSTLKAKEVLGFEANVTLSDMLDIVIPWITNAIENELI